MLALAGARSELFPISSSVLQGSLLSPVLYSVFVDDLAGRVNAIENASSTLGGRKFSHCEERLQHMLDICETHSFDNRYRFNVGKCEFVATCAPRSPFVLVYGEPLPRSANFTYLGCVFDETGINWPLHFQRLEQRANARVAKLRKIGCNGYGFNLKVCLILYKALIRPTMEYAMALLEKRASMRAMPQLQLCLRY